VICCALGECEIGLEKENRIRQYKRIKSTVGVLGAYVAMPKPLLQRIRDIRESVGTSINDLELTALIKGMGDVSESGFRFLTFYNHFALFDVPKQDISKWYREDGWLSEEKEETLRLIVKELRLKILKPPDYPQLDISDIHHHFELYSGTRKVIIIHPKFLKILVPDTPILPEQDLLSQLSKLYE
jgi:hypothetical protein